MQRAPRLRPVLTALALANLAAPSCAARDGGRERLVVAAVRQPATALYFVAREAGCFATERLDLEEHRFELGRDAIRMLMQDRADAAMAYETPTVRAAFADPRLRVLTTLHGSTRNTRLVLRRARAVEGFAGLAGATLGLAEGSNAEFFAELALRSGGVPRAQVRIVDLSPEAAVAALARGALDGAVLSDPYAARAEALLGPAARVLQSDVYTERSLLLTRDDVQANRPEAVERLVRGLACAERLVRRDPEAALRALRKELPELGEAELRAQVDRVEWGLGLDHVLLGVMRDEADWLRESGLVRGSAPDLERLLSRRPLSDVEPDAVMLLPPRRTAP